MSDLLMMTMYEKREIQVFYVLYLTILVSYIKYGNHIDVWYDNIKTDMFLVLKDYNV